MVPDLWSVSYFLVPVFAKFAERSGLHINMRKVVLIPLRDMWPAALQEEFAFLHPHWAAIRSKHWAVYLGFVLGLEGGMCAWEQFQTRV